MALYRILLYIPIYYSLSTKLLSLPSYNTYKESAYTL